MTKRWSSSRPILAGRSVCDAGSEHTDLSIDEHTTLLTTGADNLDLIALHIGLIGVPFRVIEPDELRVRIADIAARLQAGAAASSDAPRAPFVQPT